MRKSKLLIGALAVVLSLGLVSCGGEKTETAKNDKTIKIGVSPVPHKGIVENAIKPILESKGYKVEVVEFTDYVQPNVALSEKELDANFFQHVPYLEQTNKEKDLNLTYTSKVHLEPIGLYSEKVKKASEISDGMTIAIPNDPTNGARALRLLEKNDLIKLKEGDLITSKDITSNPKNLKFKELESAQLPRTLKDVDAAIINTNYALEAKLNPLKDAILIEAKDSPFANIIAIRKGDENLEKIKALTEASNSKEVKEYIEKTYNNSIIPAF